MNDLLDKAKDLFVAFKEIAKPENEEAYKAEFEKWQDASKKFKEFKAELKKQYEEADKASKAAAETITSKLSKEAADANLAAAKSSNALREAYGLAAV